MPAMTPRFHVLLLLGFGVIASLGCGSSGRAGEQGGAGVGGGGASSGGTSGGGGAGGASPACPGVEARPDVPGTTCRALDDCQLQYLCVDQPPSATCGACTIPERECENDDGCASGLKCLIDDSIDLCSCAGQLGSQCTARCTTDSCDAGERCNDGACEPTPCTDGFTCPELRVCAPERAGSDLHGCALRNCNEGYVCEAGYECDGATGNCLAVHCREGGSAVCPLNQVCDDAVAGRGCLPKPCEADANCDCGACIHLCSGAGCGPGQCHARLWVCSPPAPG